MGLEHGLIRRAGLVLHGQCHSPSWVFSGTICCIGGRSAGAIATYTPAYGALQAVRRTSLSGARPRAARERDDDHDDLIFRRELDRVE